VTLALQPRPGPQWMDHLLLVNMSTILKGLEDERRMTEEHSRLRRELVVASWFGVA